MSTRQIMPLLLLAAILVAVHPAAVIADQKADGTMAVPTIGEFKNGQGEFYNH